MDLDPNFKVRMNVRRLLIHEAITGKVFFEKKRNVTEPSQVIYFSKRIRKSHQNNFFSKTVI